MSASHTGLFETKTISFLFLPLGLVEFSDVAADKNVRAPVLIGTVAVVLGSWRIEQAHQQRLDNREGHRQPDQPLDDAIEQIERYLQGRRFVFDDLAETCS
jgi:hypothetical protein